MIFRPPQTMTYTTLPYSSAVPFTYQTLHGWSMGDTPAFVSQVLVKGNFFWNLTLLNETQFSSTKISEITVDNQGTPFCYNNMIVIPDETATSKGLKWHVYYALLLPGAVNGLTFNKGPYQVDTVCFPEGGLSCGTSLGDPLNFVDDARQFMMWNSFAGCPDGANRGGTIMVPLREQGHFTSSYGFFGPGSPVPNEDDPVSAAMFDPSVSANIGGTLIATLTGTDNNILTVSQAVISQRNAGSCPNNKISVRKNVLYTLDLRQTPYGSASGNPAKIWATSKLGCVLVMTHNNTRAAYLLIDFHGMQCQEILLTSGSSIINRHTAFVSPTGRLMVRDYNNGTPAYYISDQRFDLSINIRLPSFADPHSVNGTNTIRIF